MCPLCTALVDFDFGHSWGLHETLLVWSPFFRWSSSTVTYNIRVMLNLFRWVSQPPLRKHVCCACTWYPYRNCLFNRFGGTAAAHLPGPDLRPLHLLFKIILFQHVTESSRPSNKFSKGARRWTECFLWTAQLSAFPWQPTLSRNYLP